MNILMMTNTFAPHVGGVTRSVAAFTDAYRRRGHRVMVVAPEFENMPEDETDVVRIPAIQRFNGSDFSVVLPIPGFLTAAVDDFRPDIVHSHHPFLIGATALRVAHSRGLPLVFTHHTMYEQYTHYVPGDSKPLKRFVVNLSTSYANLCEAVFAPSESVAATLARRGVTTPIFVVPTGVELDHFGAGDGPGFRAAAGIPGGAFLVGHVGRLAPEKNLHFLAEAVAAFLAAEARAHFLVVGKGPSVGAIRELCAGVTDRLHMTGLLEHPLLASAYRAMDVFAFASQSETQGMVLTEAMAASVPVVALDAPGVREVVSDRLNGRLLTAGGLDDFVAAFGWVAALSPGALSRQRAAARATAEAFALERVADVALVHYGELLLREVLTRREAYTRWQAALRLFRAEWEVLMGVAGAAGAAFQRQESDGEALP